MHIDKLKAVLAKESFDTVEERKRRKKDKYRRLFTICGKFQTNQAHLMLHKQALTPASHSCICIYNEDVRELYEIVSLGPP